MKSFLSIASILCVVFSSEGPIDQYTIKPHPKDVDLFTCDKWLEIELNCVLMDSHIVSFNPADISKYSLLLKGQKDPNSELSLFPREIINEFSRNLFELTGRFRLVCNRIASVDEVEAIDIFLNKNPQCIVNALDVRELTGQETVGAFADLISKLNLKEFGAGRVSENTIELLSTCLSKNTSIEKLVLTECHSEMIKLFVNRSSPLKSIAFHDIGDRSEEKNSILELLQNNLETLEEIHIGRINIPPSILPKIVKTVFSCSQLKKLTFSIIPDVCFDDESFLDSIVPQESLKEVVVGWCNSKKISVFIQSFKNSALTKLTIGANESPFPKDFFTEENMKNLKCLSLTGENTELISKLKEFPNLSHIHLVGEAKPSILNECSTITTLTLDRFNFEGLESLAFVNTLCLNISDDFYRNPKQLENEILAKCPHIKHLKLHFYFWVETTLETDLFESLKSLKQYCRENQIKLEFLSFYHN